MASLVDFLFKISQTIMVDKLNQETNLYRPHYLFVIIVLFLFFQTQIFGKVFAQSETPPVSPSATPAAPKPAATSNPNDPDADITVPENDKEAIFLLDGAQPNKRRIRRHLSLIKGVKIDEEILIPSVQLKILPIGQDLITIVRIKNSDIFRIEPIKAGTGIVTLHNKKTGQIYSELHLDIRDSVVDKAIRDLKALLSDIEGLEYKAVNGGVLIDGFVMLPQDLMRLNNTIAIYQFGAPDGGPAIKINSLVTLSPIARKRIIEYISREVNNPEVTVTTVGDYIKLEGSVNSEDEKKRIADLVAIYLPTYVSDANLGGVKNVNFMPRKPGNSASDFILNLITVRKQEEKEEPPPKMIQVVFHFVEFSERYLKSFEFNFSPQISAGSAAQLNASQQVPGQNSVESIANIVNNLLPKISWAKTHGFLRVLDTASILTQEGKPATLDRGSSSTNSGGGAQAPSTSSSNTSIAVTPTISQPRAGLINLDLNVNNTPGGGSINSKTTIKTNITVRDRQSAAFGGIISKASNNDYGVPAAKDKLFTLTAGKGYTKNAGNFVVFVTPIIKTSASAGVEQVKKKFRLKE
jgi:pilus assembly protein CpaC